MIPAVFVLALLSDLLSCEWQSARHRGQVTRLGALSAVLELLSWAPVYLFVVTTDVWVIIASVAGSIVGAVWGGYRERARTTQ